MLYQFNCSLSAEVCNTSLLSAHLEFISYYKYHNNKSFTSALNRDYTIPGDIYTLYRYRKRAKLAKRANRYSRMFVRDYFREKLKKAIKKLKKNLDFYRSKLNRRNKRLFWKFNKIFKKEKHSIIINRKTYVYNRRFFTYQLRDTISNKTTLFVKNFSFLTLIKQRLWNHIMLIKNTLILWFKLFSHKSRFRRRKYRFLLHKLSNKFRRYFTYIIVRLLGFKKALYRKRRIKVRYITMIKIHKYDIKGLFVAINLPLAHVRPLLLNKLDRKTSTYNPITHSLTSKKPVVEKIKVIKKIVKKDYVKPEIKKSRYTNSILMSKPITPFISNNYSGLFRTQIRRSYSTTKDKKKTYKKLMIEGLNN